MKARLRQAAFICTLPTTVVDEVLAKLYTLLIVAFLHHVLDMSKYIILFNKDVILRLGDLIA